VEEACATVVRVPQGPVRPDVDAVAKLNKHYAAYRRVYAATHEIFA